MNYSPDDLRVELRKSLKTVLDNNFNVTDLQNLLEFIEKQLFSAIKGHTQNVNYYMPDILKEQEDDPIIDLKPTINFYNSLHKNVDSELVDLRAMLSQFFQYQANLGIMYQPGMEKYETMSETICDMFINFINTLLQLNRTIMSLDNHIAELKG